MEPDLEPCGTLSLSFVNPILMSDANMASSTVEITVKYEWHFNFAPLETNKFVESPIFGNENSATKFAIRVETVSNEVYSLWLLLASHRDPKLNVNFNLYVKGLDFHRIGGKYIPNLNF